MGSKWKHLLNVFVLTFVISVGLSFSTRGLVGVLPLWPSLLLLFVIVLIGVIFDIVGVSVTAASESPFHAMAADRIAGARHAIWLIRHADRVATFANDVVGDIAGTLSGAIGVAIIVRVAQLTSGLSETVLTTAVVASVAALTVTGKAWGKWAAVTKWSRIVRFAGLLLYWVERFIGVKLVSLGNSNKTRKKRHNANAPDRRNGKKGS